MHFKNFNQAHALVTELASIEACVLSITTIPLELNTPNPEYQGIKGPIPDVTPLEQVLNLPVEDLERIVRDAIVGELQKRHEECKRQLIALGLKFDDPKKLEAEANLKATKAPKPKKQKKSAATKLPKITKPDLKVVKPAA